MKHGGVGGDDKACCGSRGCVGVCRVLAVGHVAACWNDCQMNIEDQELRAKCRAIAICLMVLLIFFCGIAVGIGLLYNYRIFVG